VSSVVDEAVPADAPSAGPVPTWRDYAPVVLAREMHEDIVRATTRGPLASVQLARALVDQGWTKR